MSTSAQVIAAAAAPFIAADLSPFSVKSIQSVIHNVVEPQTPYWYSIGTFAVFIILYAVATLCQDYILPALLGARWKAIRPQHHRTMIVYILQILLTTAALVLQFVGAPMLVLDFSEERIQCAMAAGVLISCLYCFELIYREKMRAPMIAHHVLTLFVTALALSCASKLQDPSYLLMGYLWLFQATTEQTTFVALFLYRLKVSPKILRPMLRVASLQSLVFKTASIAGTCFVWVKWQRQGSTSVHYAFNVLFWVTTLGLGATQVWGSYVVWIMGDALEQRYSNAEQSATKQHVNADDLEAGKAGLFQAGNTDNGKPESLLPRIDEESEYSRPNSAQSSHDSRSSTPHGQ